MSKKSTESRDMQILAAYKADQEPKVIALMFGVTVWVIYKALKRVKKGKR